MIESVSNVSHRRKQDVIKEIEVHQIKILKKELQKRKILEAIREINFKSQKILAEKSKYENEKFHLQDQVKQMAIRIQDLDKELKSEKSQIRSQLMTIYKMNDGGIARLITTSLSSAELDRNLKILNKVVKLDSEKIVKFQNLKQELIKNKQKIDVKWNQLQVVLNRINEQEVKLKKEQLVKNQILDEIKQSQYFSQLKLKKIKNRPELRIEDEAGELDGLLLASFANLEGHLPLPVDGSLKKSYGIFRLENENISFPFKGLFFSAKFDSEVKAVGNGFVAFVGDVDGFGKTVMIDHGDHFYTLYSNLKDSFVTLGAQVQEKQRIGLVGASHLNLGNGLYFEMRHFTEAIDPQFWFEKLNPRSASVAKNIDLENSKNAK